MAEITKIEWADHTFNPWIGCTKVSPGCDNCYAEAREDKRFGRVKWGVGNPRSRTSTWDDPVKWNRQAEVAGARPFVFCASLSDVFDNEVDSKWRDELIALIGRTPNLIWLLLTKRIGNVLKMLDGPLPRNVAIGATMINQTEYDRDIGKLAEIKSLLGPVFTFSSIEPLLGPITLDANAADWLIVGGESGPNARSMDLDWARSLREQCHGLERVFNFKQVGSRGKGKGGHELDGLTYFDRPEIARTRGTKSRTVRLSIPVESIVVTGRLRDTNKAAVQCLAKSPQPT